MIMRGKYIIYCSGGNIYVVRDFEGFKIGRIISAGKSFNLPEVIKLAKKDIVKQAKKWGVYTSK